MADASKGKKPQANPKGQQAPAKAANASPNTQPQQPKDQNKNQPPQKQSQPNKQQNQTQSNQNQPPVKETKKETVQSPPQEQKQVAPQPTEAPAVVAHADPNVPAEKKKAPKPQRDYERGRGVVKAVLSGDLLVVISMDKVGGPPQEKEVQITNINAPKLGKRNKDGKRDPDEDFAFGSREFLRKATIGKQVSYTIENKGKSTGKIPREYAVVFVLGRDGKETDLAQLMVSEGWAKVRRREPKEGQTAGPLRSDVEELMKMEEEARKAERGLHTKNANAKKAAVRPNVEFQTSELYEKFKSAPQHGVVERCLTGSTIIVTLLPSFHEIKILLSGVECPGQNQSGDFEPWGREAKFCTEHFLLHRDVQVILEGADKFNLFGTLDLGGNNISEELLKRGLAKYVEWSGSRTAFVDKLRAAEKASKDKKLGLWGSYVEPKAPSKAEENKTYKTGKEIHGRVTQVINGGLIIVTDQQNAQHEISLSSIILPKGGNMRPKEKKEEGKEEVKEVKVGEVQEKTKEVQEKERQERVEALERTLAWEAKEYVRRRLIGQRVRCVFDYTQTPGTPQQQGQQSNNRSQNRNDEPRNYFSVYLDKNNIAVELTAAGLAQPRNHRGGEQRSKDYEDILKAETLATKSNRGRHAPDSKRSVLYVNDVSGNADKAKKFLPSMKRGRNRGVVVHVLNAGKLRIYVPKESSEITFSLSGLKTPRMEEAFNAESTAFTKEKLSQREVEFEVTAVDRGGNFVGNLWGPNRENLAVSLVKEGYAGLIRGIAKELENYNQLDEAELDAKQKKKNIWVNWNQQEEDDKREKRRAEIAAEKGLLNQNKGPREQEFVDVVVTEIIDASRFYVQIVGEEAAKLEELMANLATDDYAVEDFKPKNRDLVKAQYSDDNNWYRASISGEDNGNFTVFYIDYGNSETLPASAIKPLAAKFNTAVLKAQAVEAKLAFLKVPTLDEDYGTEAAEYLKEMVESKTMMANVEYKDSTNVIFLSLGDRESNVHVNAAMVRAGLARVKKPKGEYLTKSKQAVEQLLAKLREEETTARKSHACIWEYGDPGSDDDDDRDIKAIEAKKKAAAELAAKQKGSPAVGKK